MCSYSILYVQSPYNVHVVHINNGMVVYISLHAKLIFLKCQGKYFNKIKIVCEII